MMQTIIKMIGLVALAACVTIGCTDREVNGFSVEEGQPATIALTFRKNESVEVKTRAGRSVDTDLKQVYILIFDAGAGQPLKTLYKGAYSGGTVLVNTHSGASIVQVVTNIGQNTLIPGGDTFFDNVTTLADFQKKMAEIRQVQLSEGQTLPMSGSASQVLIQPGENTGTITIPVNRLTAKISLEVVKEIPATDKVDLLSWEVVNVPGYSYIGMKDDRDAADDRVETSGDSNYFHTVAHPFDLVLPSTGGNTPLPGTAFYIFENRKGNVASVSTQLQRAAKAPVRATYIDIKARYQNTTEVKNTTYRVHLGKNNLTNYDVERNTHHIYTLTIKGLTKYSTHVSVVNQDSRVVLGDTIFTIDLFEPTLDAHYDWRPVRIRAFPGYSRVEVTDDAGNPIALENSWLKLSLNKTWPTLAEIAADSKLSPATKLDELHHIEGVGSETVYLYADEMFENDIPITTERKLKLRFTYTHTNDPANLDNPDSCYTLVKEITQRPPMLMDGMGIRAFDQSGNVVPGNGSVFAVERQDEFRMKLAASGLAATPLTNGMGWGFGGLVMQPAGTPVNYYRTDGWNNTLGLVFRSSGQYWNQNDAAEIGTPAYTGNFDALYNTYAARYAIEKNRDLNGNGILEDNEIRWYLPSREEMMLLWIGKNDAEVGANANEILKESYWGSTEYSAVAAVDINFHNGSTGGGIPKTNMRYVRAIRKMTDPAPGDRKSPYVIDGTREITGFPAKVSEGHPDHVKGEPYPIHGAEQQKNTVSPMFEVAKQDCSDDGNPLVDSGIQQMYWYQAAGYDTLHQIIVNPPTGCNAYWEGDRNDPERGIGMWRLPTQRELMTIWLLRNELGADGFVPLAPRRYWSAALYYGEGWFTDFSNGYTGAVNASSGDSRLHHVRCVRDVQTP